MAELALRRNYELQLPVSFVDVDNEEMEYVDGGYQLYLNLGYLLKSNCLSVATDLLNRGIVKGMTRSGLAEEIYAHAWCFFNSFVIKGFNVCPDAVVDYIRAHANPVDITDGGDVWYRKALYSAIWALNMVA